MQGSALSKDEVLQASSSLSFVAFLLLSAEASSSKDWRQSKDVSARVPGQKLHFIRALKLDKLQ
jgi:hypothetical protein